MLWVWVVVVASLAIAAYLWMRIDEVEKAKRDEQQATPRRQTASATRTS
jgi:hypothetical protein